jgi:hypothetical protein
MKTRQRRFDNYKRPARSSGPTRWSAPVRKPAPSWWSPLLSLFVAFTLVVQPAQLCAMLESSPGHSHGGHSHKGDSHASHSDASHPHVGASHHQSDDNDQAREHHAAVEHEATEPAVGGLALMPSSSQHMCCSDDGGSHAVTAATRRSFSPEERLVSLSNDSGIVSATPDIFTLTACHGRDGPPGHSLRSQLSHSSLLGRAPPVVSV